jgi:hypothetical protein
MRGPLSARELAANHSSEWQPPTELPDLRRAGIISIDVKL